MQPLLHIPDLKNEPFLKYIAERLTNLDRASIGITGAGGAGKSTLAINLMNYFGRDNSVAIDLDDYLISRSERGRLGLTGYQPGANKLSLARQQILALKSGNSIQKPIYDHATGNNIEIELVEPRSLLIFEGITTLYPELDDLYDLSIFLNALEETQIQSRIMRDVNKRGYSLEEALALHENLKPHYQKYIEPTKSKATIIGEVGIDYVIHRKR